MQFLMVLYPIINYLYTQRYEKKSVIYVITDHRLIGFLFR